MMDVSGVAELVAPSAIEESSLSSPSKTIEAEGGNCCPTDLIRDQFAGDWSHHRSCSGFSGRAGLWLQSSWDTTLCSHISIICSLDLVKESGSWYCIFCSFCKASLIEAKSVSSIALIRNRIMNIRWYDKVDIRIRWWLYSLL